MAKTKMFKKSSQDWSQHYGLSKQLVSWWNKDTSVFRIFFKIVKTWPPDEHRHTETQVTATMLPFKITGQQR